MSEINTSQKHESEIDDSKRKKDRFYTSVIVLVIAVGFVGLVFGAFGLAAEEISGERYGHLLEMSERAEMWEDQSVAEHIHIAMEDGVVSNWEYRRIRSAYDLGLKESAKLHLAPGVAD